MSQEEKNIPVEQQRLEKEQIEDMGSVYRTRGAHAIHCLTVIGQVEGHVEAPQGQKTTKYEHVIPQLVAVQEDPAIEGLPTPKEPNLQARMNALRRQVEEMVEQKGEYTAMPQARAQTMHYMKGLKGAAALRRYCCTLSRLEDLDELITAVFEEQRKAGLDPDDVREVPFP